MKIYFSEDSQLTELAIAMKGWRGDILVEINDNYYNIKFLTIERILGEFEWYKENNKNDVIHAYTILVDDISKDNIIQCIKRIDPHDFEMMKPENLTRKYGISPRELQNGEQWVEVFSDSD